MAAKRAVRTAIRPAVPIRTSRSEGSSSSHRQSMVNRATRGPAAVARTWRVQVLPISTCRVLVLSAPSPGRKCCANAYASTTQPSLTAR